jgi:hypothetical protein
VTAPSIADASTAGETLHCYRHPDRETWVRCGRCDRPICPKCAMQGPVGLRCRDCGRPAFDPLTSFTPVQLVVGLVVSVGAGIVTGYLASRIGFFSVIVAWFAGGIIADIVSRLTGYKHGPVMLAVVVGGILVGALAGAALAFWVDYGTYLAVVQGDPEAEDAAAGLGPFLLDTATWAIISAGAASVGAWQRLRW